MRSFRIWGKKRGDRRTGSEFLGNVGEAVFFSTLFLVASITLVVLLTIHVAGLLEQAGTISGWSLWLWLLVLGSLIMIGAGGLIRNVMLVGASAERRAAIAKKAADLDLLGDALPSDREYPTIPRDENLTNSPGIRLAYRLPIAHSPAWKLIATGLFCLAWNGFVAVIIVLTIRSYLQENTNAFLALFAAPFLIVGIRSVQRFFRQLLLNTGIGPTSVEVSDLPFVPGNSYQVFMTQAGRLSVKSLSLFLVCDEEAVFRQGTDIRTEVRQVRQQQLFRHTNFEISPGAPFEHECEFRVPEDVMHSFKSNHNAVQWRMVLQSELEHWPSFQRDFPVVVYPCI